MFSRWTGAQNWLYKPSRRLQSHLHPTGVLASELSGTDLTNILITFCLFNTHLFWITKEPHKTDALILCYIMIRSNYYFVPRTVGSPAPPGTPTRQRRASSAEHPQRDFCKNALKPRLHVPINTTVVPEGGDKISAFRWRGLTWLIN